MKITKAREEFIKNKDKEIKIKITLNELEDNFENEEFKYYNVEIDGIEWLTTENITHAIVLFEMMKEHISEYMNYKMI